MARNPYAPSRASLRAGIDPTTDSTHQVWRDGRTVVALLGAHLPDRCVKCNEPADLPTRHRTLYWHSSLIYLTLALGVLPYIIIASIVRKSARVDPGLCAYHKRRRMLALAIGWLGALAGLAFFFYNLRWNADVALLGLAVLFACGIIGAVGARLVHAKKIDDERVRLGGFCNAYREELPEWPG